MTEQEAMQNLSEIAIDYAECGEEAVCEALDMAIKALEVKSKITEIVNRQLIAGKSNYKEVYDCFHEIVKIVQENY